MLLILRKKLCKQLLGVKFDQQITFDQHVKILCKKANAKLKSLSSVVRYMGLSKRISTVYHVSKSLSYISPKILKSIPTESKQKSSLNVFKESVKLYQPLDSMQAV